jgi:sec-independent protein translocase protein TatC
MIFRSFAHIAADLRALATDEPEDESLPDTFAKTIENPSGVLEHLNALRRHLLRSVVVLLITTGISFYFTEQVLGLLAAPIGGLDRVQAIRVTESLGTFMRVALLSGFAIALPYIAFELWLFAAPGLRRSARFMGLISIPLVTLFFLGGMAFAYYIMLPTALPFLLDFMGVRAVPTLSDYVGFVTSLMFWIGVAFQFPLVIFVLALMGILQPRALVTQWRLAVVIIAVVSAMITPTVDPVSMGLVMAPLVGLYFLSILLAYLAAGRRR